LGVNATAPTARAPAVSVGNCSLTVPALKESLTLRQVPARGLRRHDDLGRCEWGGNAGKPVSEPVKRLRAHELRRSKPIATFDARLEFGSGSSDLCPAGDNRRQSTATSD
jgi:hypothetical protein